MGIFDRWKKKEDVSDIPQKTIQSESYINILSKYIGKARLHQLAFGEYLDDRDWEVDFSLGEIYFNKLPFPIGFIGSESDISNTWLWGVDNINQFSEEIISDVTEFYHGSIMANLNYLKQSSLPIDSLFNGHNISSLMTASGEKNLCYYCCSYEGGAAFVVVKDLPEEIFSPASGESILSAITDLISQMELNHHLLVQNILEENCKQLKEGENHIEGVLSDNRIINFTFDSQGRIDNMKLS